MGAASTEGRQAHEDPATLSPSLRPCAGLPEGRLARTGVTLAAGAREGDRRGLDLLRKL